VRGPASVRLSRRSVAALALLSLTALGAPARADLSIRSSVDADKIGVEDQVHLTITLAGDQIPGQVPMPTLTNLEHVGSPMTSSQVSFMNGAVTRTQSYTFVLQPRAPGRAEIGAIRVMVGTKEYVAPAIPIEVAAGSVKPKATAPPDPMDPFGGEDPLDSMFRRGRGRGPEPKVFVEASVNRNRVFVGEPLLLTYSLYTQTSVADLRFGEPPKYAGFWTEDLPKPPQLPGGEPVTVNGEPFRRFPLFQKLLFPTKAGKVPVPPTTLKIGVQRGGGFFDMPTNEVVERATKPLEVVAEPVPDHPEFSGAVGRFSATATLDRPSAALGEAVTLRFEVHGNGNLKWIDRGPDVKLPGAKVYPPQVTSDLKATPTGITGTKTWEIVVVPETTGTVSIPALTFPYFDPEKRALVDAATAPLTLDVHGAPGAATKTSPASAGARAGGPLPLRSELDLPIAGWPRLSVTTLATAVGFVLLVHGALWAAPWLLERRRDTASGHPAGHGRDVRRVLSDLERVGRDGMTKEASVALIERALHDVFGPLQEDATTPESQRERAAREVLQEIYFIRYAPQLGDYSEQIRHVARRAADVVRRWT
jgi:hypothetical protein